MEILIADEGLVVEDSEGKPFQVTELTRMVVVLLIPMFGLILSTFVLAFEFYHKHGNCVKI